MQKAAFQRVKDCLLQCDLRHIALRDAAYVSIVYKS